jgi:malate dehydrogenase (oxaloacetate-decarboxylating)
MKPLRPPFDRMARGLPVEAPFRGPQLLGSRFFTKEMAFSHRERDALALTGLLPRGVLSIREQVTVALEQVRAKTDDLEKYIALAALQDRNATLFYRLLTDHLDECMPIVYTPTVGRACQEFSHILRRTRGLWITPGDRGRIRDVLRNSPYEDVRLIVATDNERILGLGDQGAGGMAIPIGKLALYTAASGIHPSLTLPLSLDVGTDNAILLSDPLYVGWRHPRLRGAEYDRIVEEFVDAVAEVWPGCVIQWEDFKQSNALRILERYRGRVTSFNDDIQGTAAVVVGGILAALRHLEQPLATQRVVILGAGAAGIGIARLIRRAMTRGGATDEQARSGVVLVDSHGLVAEGRTDLDADKASVALCPEDMASYGISAAIPQTLREVIAAVHPTILVGVTGVYGSFDEASIREMARHVETPIVLPLSNPTSRVEAHPADLMVWTEGRGLIATGSPFSPVPTPKGRMRAIGQANNVFVFPGVGLGAIAAEATAITDEMFLAAADVVAEAVTKKRFAEGGLFPPVAHLRAISRRIAVAVADEARRAGVSGLPDSVASDEAVDQAIWEPAYVDYILDPADLPPEAADPDDDLAEAALTEGPTGAAELVRAGLRT